ncbi:hypothetical protein D5086_000427 [Populus alba]|uniref:Uncharacterized protein n=1 Tax=Populus alba TaxID=43335 RepID=A0ACC4CVU3_POPAL
MYLHLHCKQPLIYGRGPMPAGMHMVPMVLPDGRIGYVLQQPGVQMAQPLPRRVDRNNGPSGPGQAGNSSDDGNRGKSSAPPNNIQNQKPHPALPPIVTEKQHQNRRPASLEKSQ